MDISSTLKDLRLSEGLTQCELAQKLQIGQSTIVGYEKGLREPTITNLKKYAAYFDVSIDYLSGEEDDFKPSAKPQSAAQSYSSDELKFLDDFLSLPPNLQNLIRSNVDTLLKTQSGQKNDRKTK